MQVTHDEQHVCLTERTALDLSTSRCQTFATCDMDGAQRTKRLGVQSDGHSVALARWTSVNGGPSNTGGRIC